MAGMNFEYDERGGTFYYFLVSFYAFILIPLTYYLWPRSRKTDGINSGVDSKNCRCEPCNRKEIQKRSKEPWRKWRQRFAYVFFLVAWLGFFVLIYKAAHVETDHIEWDPYGVLGLDRGASMEEVKKAYRHLTRKHHPDKGGDEKRFVEITKAHLALTDEESKKNYDLYGNPDGPGAQTFGIALPSWIVSKEYSFFVLLAYGLVFMVLLPTVVGIWWYRSIRYSADSVLMKTTELFLHMEHKTSLLNVKRVIAIISGAFEFCRQFNKEVIERPSDDIEVPILLKQFPSVNENKRDGPLCWPYSLKARALLYAHLSRMRLSPETLQRDLHYILKKSSYLLQEMIHVYSQLYMYASSGRTMRMPALETLDNIMKTSPMLVQALWESKNPLLQLPHVTEEVLRRSAFKKKRYLKTCAALCALSDDERREALRGINDRQYWDVLTVLASMPRVEMEVVVEVRDDEDKTVTVGALVTAVVKLRRTPLFELKGARYQRGRVHTLPAPNSFDEQDLVDTGSDLDEVDVEHVNEDEENTNVANEGPSRRPVWEKNKKKKGGKNKAKHKQQNKKLAATPIAKKTDAVQAAKSASGHLAEGKDRESSEVEKEEEHSSSSDVENLQEAVKECKEEEEDDDDDLLLDDDFSRREKVLEAKSKATHLVHCPHYPEDKYEWWWVYICDRKNRQLICPPARVTTLVAEETVELRFAAQTKPGVYCLQVCLRSDSYLDCDVARDVKYTVAEARQITSHPQWEFAEDDDDDKKSVAELSEEASEYTEDEEDVSD